ncbi:MAG: 3-phosphoshikimate 1-carboxyvinyltransferase [Alphaproteobacteria bacterium]|nr:3-phosphoshikimate 1-carboxyvinyltransferase [Alphaproteobacteria bacterium]
MSGTGGAISHPCGALAGKARAPGDKSVSHRALMLAGVAVGETRIDKLLEGEDVLATAAALRALGVEIERIEPGCWRVHGRGVGGLTEPEDVLDMGNSGTAARLLLGLLATHKLTATLTGDASLRSRPMRRVSEPLSRFGAAFHGRTGGQLPLTVVGADVPVPIRYELPVASAQVKSAVLLAGLNTPGETVVVEPMPTRDHTERMLRHFGACVQQEEGGVVRLTGEPELTARPISVPGDISSAAFPLVAAAILPDSCVTVTGVGLNPGRIGLLETLREMGAALAVANERVEGGEPVGDITVTWSPLAAVDVPPERVPGMIDEFPILAVAATFAEGTTRMSGLGELRVKESDRLGVMAAGLAACGVEVRESADTLEVDGGRPRGGVQIESRLDHRIAMAFMVLGMGAREAVQIDDITPVATSFPNFVGLMNGLGAALEA